MALNAVCSVPLTGVLALAYDMGKMGVFKISPVLS